MKSTPDEAKKAALCVKGRFGFSELTGSGRLTSPLIKKDGILTPVSWEEANLYVAKKLQSVSVRYGSDAVAVSVSDKLTNEEIYAAKKYANDCLKTPTVFCYGMNKSGVEEVTGFDGSTSKLEELLSTEVIVLVGTDIMKEHAVLGVKIRQAAARGAKVIVVSNKPDSQEAQEASLYINADNTSALKAILKALTEAGATASGIDKFKESLSNTVVTKEANQAAGMLMKAKKVMVVVDQFNVKAEAAKAAADIAVLSGEIGSPRNGIIQIKANANSQGLCDLGVAPLCLTKDKLTDGSVKAMLILGEDVGEFDASKFEFVAVADMYLTETAKKADAVLPLVSLAESTGTITSCDSTTSAVTAAIPPLSKTNLEVIKGIANAMKVNLDYSDEKTVAQEMTEKQAVKKLLLNIELKAVEDTEIYLERINTNYAYEAFKKLMLKEGIN